MQPAVLVNVINRINVASVFPNAVKRFFPLVVGLKPRYSSADPAGKVLDALPFVGVALRSSRTNRELSLLGSIFRDRPAIAPLMQLVHQVIKGSAQVKVSVFENQRQVRRERRDVLGIEVIPETTLAADRPHRDQRMVDAA